MKSESGSQDPREKEILRSNGPSDQENPLVIHARVIARAKAIDPGDKRARVRFIASLIGNDYIRGETAPRLAELWGLKTNTVEADASTAWAMIQEHADPAVDHAIWWREVFALLEAANEDGRIVREWVDQSRDGEGRLAVDAMGLKFMGDAMGRSRDSMAKALELIGKASGLLQSGAKGAVTVNVGELGKSREFSQLQAALERFSQRADERHRAMLREELGRGEAGVIEVEATT